jgi:hypothetical protein
MAPGRISLLSQDACRNGSIPRHSLHHQNSRGTRVSVVRVRENYHSGLLIGSDSKMNGTLNSEGCRPQNLAHCGFQCRVAVSAHAMADATSIEPSGGVLRAKGLGLSAFAVHELVHDLNQALPDGGESGALELRIYRR